MNRKVYILLTDTGTVFTKVIKLYTRKPYNHASLVLDEQFDLVYSFGRKNPKNPFLGGFVREDLRGSLFKNADCAIYCLNLNETQFHRMVNKIKEIEQRKNKYRYNLLGLIAVMLNVELNRKNAYFCSHFVASVLEESGVRINRQKPLSLVTPQDIKNCPSLEFIYEGKLSAYFEYPETSINILQMS
ncbi:hypothetical protein [Neobacillus muris]|uniref:hypothetical protein n=1 Tax=Neobacillus muris TaxID=2941334 RepID=UPI00203FB151|nr:hypothetical protein [Neobacillus muris]